MLEKLWRVTFIFHVLLIKMQWEIETGKSFQFNFGCCDCDFEQGVVYSISFVWNH